MSCESYISSVVLVVALIHTQYAAGYGEAEFHTWGVNLQLVVVAPGATRLVLIQTLLTSKAGVVKNLDICHTI